MSDQTFNPNVEEGKTLFEKMQQKGLITPASKTLVISNLDDSVMAAVAGASANAIGVEDPITLLLVLDSSGSMALEKTKTKTALRNLVKGLKQVQKDTGAVIIFSLILFGDPTNIVPLVPFTQIDLVDTKVIDDYDPSDGSTALYDGTFYGLTGHAGYGFELFINGVRGGRRLFVVLTDGGENNSKLMTDADLPKMAGFMADLRKPKNTVFGFLAVGDDNYFRPIARRMGFLDKNIRTVDKLGGMMAALELVSQSVAWHSRSQSMGQPMLSAGQPEPSMFEEEDEDSDIFQ